MLNVVPKLCAAITRHSSCHPSLSTAGPVVIDIENITKDYVMGEETVRALRGVSLQIHR